MGRLASFSIAWHCAQRRASGPVWEMLQKLKFPTLLLAAGLLLVTASAFDQINLKELVLHPRETTATLPLCGGTALILLAVLIFLLDEGLLRSFGSTAVRRTPSGFACRIGRSRIALHFGRLEAQVSNHSDDETPLVMLPTNEFFDDDCFKATGTACGAYLRAKAPNHLDKLKNEIEAEKVKREPIGQFEKEHGKSETSYGAGTCLFIEHPPGLAHSLLLAAVASKRAGIGFQSNPAYIFRCVEQMATIATDKRIASVFMPLVGAGKGGLTAGASLMTILLSLSTMQRRLGGFDSAINIVIFQADPRSEPSIDKRSARALLGLAASMHSAEKTGR